MTMPAHWPHSVQEAVLILGNGFLAHPANEALRARLAQGELTSQAYFDQLVWVVFRITFLHMAEDRELLYPRNTSAYHLSNYRCLG